MSNDLAGPRQRRRMRRPPALVNRTVLAILRSPLHGLLDRRLCELSYRGRRSGKAVTLPVMYALHDNDLVILVGDAGAKRWWRNFTDPAPIVVRLDGRVRVGSARVVAPGDAGYAPAWTAYMRRHRLNRQPGDRLLIIEHVC
jgi:hypothetical protein